jgi:hypothetical protein
MKHKTQEQLGNNSIGGNWAWVGDIMTPTFKQKISKRKKVAKK